MVDLENDSMLGIGGGEKKLIKGHLWYTTRDNAQITLWHVVVVVPVST